MHDWQALVRTRLGPLDLDPVRAAEVIDEMAQHIAQHHAELVAGGTPDDVALAEALKPLAARAALAREIVLTRRSILQTPAPPASTAATWMTSLRMDIRYAIRLLRRSPGFAALVILTLALGIGANTAVFGVLNAVLLRPLPFTHADRLVTLGGRDEAGGASSSGFTTILDWRDRVHSLDQIAIVRDWQAAIPVDGEVRRIQGMRVSANFFPMLGVSPALGRAFRPEEDTQNDWRVVLLSDRLWRRAFHADPAVLERPVEMNGRQYRVIGVMPASFEPLISERYYGAADLWALLGYDATLPYACRTCRHLHALGLLRPGVSLTDARDELQRVENDLQREHPADYAQGATMAMQPLGDALQAGVSRVIWMLMAAVGLVLLIACATVANLLLARLTRRARELSVRVAIGASRARIVQQTLVESLVLSVAAGLVSLLVAALTVPLLTGLAPASTSRLAGAGIDLGVLGFSLALAVVSGLIFGLMPAIRAWRVDLREAVQSTRGRTTSGNRTRHVLMAAEVALALMLLAGAGLMIRSVAALLAVRPGFDPSHVLVVHAQLIGQQYAQDEAVLQAQDAIVNRLHALPGVRAVAVAGQIPLDGGMDQYGFHIEGQMRGRDGADDPSVERYGVTPEYFAAMSIPLIRGRLLTSADTATGDPVLVISENTAAELWPGRDPLGARVRIGAARTGPWRTIVGIVGSVRHESMASPPSYQMYTPQTQFTDSDLTIVIRTASDPVTLTNEARRAVREIVPDAPIENITSLDALVDRSVGQSRFVMVLLTMFGGVALALTAVGVYGVIACSVAERTREIGIRGALGASTMDVVRLVLGGGFVVVAIGIVAGVGGAFAGVRLLRASLYGISPHDPVTLTAVIGVLLLTALAAHAVPLMRALRVAPTVALRDE